MKKKGSTKIYQFVFGSNSNDYAGHRNLEGL